MKKCTYLLLFLLFGCKDIASSNPAKANNIQSPSKPKPIIKEKNNDGLAFSFFNHRAEMQTVDDIDLVAKDARSAVMVTDLKHHRLKGDSIYVADLRKKNKDNHYPVWIQSRSAWLDRTMPKLSEIPKEIFAKRHSPSKIHRSKRRRKRARFHKKKAKVVVFSTSWCPSCRNAKAFLRSKGVPFVDVDVEKDLAGQQEYLKLIQEHGMKHGVPVIVVNGKVFQGFVPQQIEAALKG